VAAWPRRVVRHAPVKRLTAHKDRSSAALTITPSLSEQHHPEQPSAT